MARRATSSSRRRARRWSSASTRLSKADFPTSSPNRRAGSLGYAYAGAFRPRPAYRFIVENSVYVAPQAKGRGIGRLLLQRLIAEAQALGFRQMIAVIGDGKPDSPSVRLHERMGFLHSGRLEGSGYKHGRWLDTVFMQLAMNGGTQSAARPCIVSGAEASGKILAGDLLAAHRERGRQSSSPWPLRGAAAPHCAAAPVTAVHARRPLQRHRTVDGFHPKPRPAPANRLRDARQVEKIRACLIPASNKPRRDNEHGPSRRERSSRRCFAGKDRRLR